MIADEILKIIWIYPPHAADADGSKLAVAVIDNAVNRLLRQAQDFGNIADREQTLRLVRARRRTSSSQRQRSEIVRRFSLRSPLAPTYLSSSGRAFWRIGGVFCPLRHREQADIGYMAQRQLTIVCVASRRRVPPA